MEQPIFSVLLRDLFCSSNLIMFPRIMNIPGEKIHHLATFWIIPAFFYGGFPVPDFKSEGLSGFHGTSPNRLPLRVDSSPEKQTVTEMAPLDWVYRNWQHTLRIQVCPKKGIISTILCPMTWGWDLDHQSYSREGSGFLGIYTPENWKTIYHFLWKWVVGMWNVL